MGQCNPSLLAVTIPPTLGLRRRKGRRLSNGDFPREIPIGDVIKLLSILNRYITFYSKVKVTKPINADTLPAPTYRIPLVVVVRRISRPFPYQFASNSHAVF